MKVFSLIFLLVISCAALRAQDLNVMAEASPTKLAVGQTGTYTIRFFNIQSIPNLNTPRVQGLSFSNQPQSFSRRQFINGVSSVETGLTWQFSATQTGKFTIPGRTLQIQGKSFSIKDITIEAVPQGEEFKNRHFIKVDLPDRDRFYVGESIPVTLRLYVRTDTNLQDLGLPQRQGDNFSQTELSREPRRYSSAYEGQPFIIWEWFFVLSPLKAQESGLQFTQDLILETSRGRQGFPSIFDFPSRSRERITVASETFNLNVLPLPEEDQPSTFDGAIGEFEVTGSLNERQLTVGEPTTLKISLKGKGNFDRIIAPEFPEQDQWKIYPPKTEFQSESEHHYQGTKTFEYILIPMSESLETVPEFSYVFFDPNRESYIQTIIDPEPITVQPGQGPISTPGQPSSTNESATQDQERSSSLRPLASNFGKAYSNYYPLWQSVYAWITFLSVLMLLFLGSHFLRKRLFERDNLVHQQHRIFRQDARKRLRKATDAARENNPDAFFTNACDAVRKTVATLFHTIQNPETYTLDDILHKLEDQHSSRESYRWIRDLFAKAEAYRFAGVVPDQETLEKLARELNTQINKIQK